MREAQDTGEYIAERVEIDENGCWNWTLSIGHKGYGQYFRGYHSGLVHRHSYEHHVGAIPEGMQLDHLCRNRKCCNPEHLEPVTDSENQRRGNLARTGRNYSLYQIKDGRWRAAIEIGDPSNSATGRRRKVCTSVSRDKAVSRMEAWIAQRLDEAA